MPRALTITLAVFGALVTIGLPTAGAIFYFGQLDQRISVIENDKGAALSVVLQHLGDKLEELDEQQKILVDAMHKQDIRNATADQKKSKKKN